MTSESEIQPGRYQHFKGPEYDVLGVARHSETKEELVIYHRVDSPSELWVRPLSMWTEIKESPAGPVPRFRRLR